MSAGDSKDYRSVGEILREARQDKGLTIEQLHELTKISPKMITALENDDLDLVGNALYAKSFVRNLGQALDLDASWLLTKLDAAPSIDSPVEGQDDTWHIDHVDNVRVRRAANDGGARRWIAIVVVLAVVAGLLFWVMGRSRPESVGTASAPPVAAEVATGGNALEAATEVLGDDEPGEERSASEPTENEQAVVEAVETDVTEFVAEQPAADGDSDSPTQEVEEEQALEVPVRRTPVSTPPPPPEEVVVEEPDRGLGSILRDGPTPASKPPLELRIRALSAMEVWGAADGATRQRRVVQDGEVWVLQGREYFSVVLEKPDQVEVLLNGVARIPPRGHTGEWMIYPDQGGN